jgi:outer membrane protein TolC
MKLVTVLVCGGLCVAPAIALAQSSSAITLAAAVDEALAHNDRLIDQRDSITQADLGIRLAKNDFRPKVTPNILGSFGRTDVSSQTYRVDVSDRLTTGTELRLGVGTVSSQIPGDPALNEGDIQFYNADTTLTLTQPLLRGFGRSVARRPLTSAEFRREDVGRQQSLAEQQIAIEVAAAYYRVVAQRSFIAVARQSLERSRKLRDASEAKLDAGLVSQLDTLRAQQLVSQAEIQLFDAQSAEEDARDQLAFLLGRRNGEGLDVQRDVPKLDQEPTDLPAATSLALANRLDLKSLAAGRVDADRQLSFTKNQLLPQVDVNFALTRRTTADSFKNSFGLNGFEFATFLTIAMPVDRTAQQIEYQRVAIDRDHRERQVTTLERQITEEVKRGARERDRLVRAAIAADTNVQLGQQEVEVAQLRYDTGLSNNLDVVTAESGLLAAESRRIQALADAAVAKLRFRALIGVFDPRQDIP